jgi:TonB-dependent starch-binding outer membrane protein SusC
MEKTHLCKPCLQLFFASLITMLLLFASQTSYAQRTVSGTVRDATGNTGLPGASVELKGTNTATVTDANGNFSIGVPDNNATLVISYVGYLPQELRVGNQANINVSLSATGELANVVVVGYGTQNKRDVTGSVKSLKTEDFNRGIINSPQQLLQGKVAGVNVTSASGEPGSVQGITIRGPGGVRTGSTPLFVVDGLPLDNSSTGGGDPLNFINPQDIESIDVLKDASATAIYGSRGANGVIIITTKRGKAGVSILGLSTSIGVSKIARALPVLSAEEFRVAVPQVGGILDDKGGSTDWQKEVTRTAITQNHNLTLSGGADKLTYYASFGAQKQQGIIKKNQLDRYSGRFNATQRFLEDRLTLEVNLNVANTKNEKPPVQAVIGDAIANNPTYAAYGADGKPAIYQNISNPLLYFDLDKDVTTINRVIGNISPSLKIIKGLVYKLNFGIDNSTGTRHLQALPFAVPQRDGRLESFQTNNRNTLVENYLTYAFNLGNHNISALAGHSYQKIFVHGTNTSINRFPISGIEPMYNPGYGQELTLAGNRPGGYAFINELQSFFGRVNYELNNKYLLTANFRADGSSKFGANNKYGYFPSFSFGWRISEEAFMEDLPFSNLKLRAGWGKTGNQEIPPKATQALFNSLVTAGVSYPLNPAPPYPAGNVYARLANPFLQWESSAQTNVGLDFAFFNGALSGSVDRFFKTSNNILLEVPPADPVQPAGTLWANIEDMQIVNNGWEFDAEYNHNSENGIRYSIGGNLTLIKNKVENSPYSVITSGSASGSGLTSATINGYINGQPIGAFLLKEYIGLDNAGVSKYNDYDKDGSISDKDRIVAGTALPSRIYSFYGTAGFRGFDFAINFNGVAGNKIYDNTANSFFYKAKIAKSVNTTKDAYTETAESINNAAAVSTRYLKDGAYLRLNNLSLGYNLNTTNIGLNRWVKSLRVSITGQNLFVITDYDGYDPEVNTDRSVSGISSYGIDYLSYPKARSIIFGLNVSF